MSFQTTVLMIAGILLVVFLVFIAYTLYTLKTDVVFPPEQAECPDYWKVVGVNTCENVQNLGNCPGTMDFNLPQYMGPTGIKSKQAWAQQCGVEWDGVSNYNVPDAMAGAQ
jgi:hypothetical protein